MPKTKRPRVVLSESSSDNDEDLLKPQENKRRGRKSSKLKEDAENIQLKIDTCFAKVTHNSSSLKKNTIDSYFSAKPKLHDVSRSKREKKPISVDEFFSLPSNSCRESPTHSKSILKEKNKVDSSNCEKKISSPESSCKSSPKKMNTSILSDPQKTVSASNLIDSKIENKNPNLISLKDTIYSSPKSSKILVPQTPMTPVIEETPETPQKSHTFDLESPTLNRNSVNSSLRDSSIINNKKSTPKSSSHSSYWSFKSRDGPRCLGERKLPKAKPNCLKGLTFVFTGVLDYLERDDAQKLVEECGARVTKALSKKTTHIISGREPGESKLVKAREFGTKILEEKNFLDFVIEKTGKNLNLSALNFEDEDDELLTDLLQPSNTINKEALNPNKFISAEPLVKNHKFNGISNKKRSFIAEGTLKEEPNAKLPCTSSDQTKSSNLWVDIYRPKTRQTLVGQLGEKSPTNKLFAWLKSWKENFNSGAKAKSTSNLPPWGSSSDDGKWARAVLISGPPGIGKTTSAEVVCAELKFKTVELNASDARSKKLMQEELADSLTTYDISSFALGKKNNISSSRHVLIMDEVDGMSGNQDRGGMQELILMIKQTKVPIICLCNDRQSTKIRSLANYCYDLRFQRPRIEQIKSALMSILFKEKATIPVPILNEIIEASNHDIRQVVNTAQLWCAKENTPAINEDDLKYNTAAAKKNLQLGPFEVIRKVFQPEIGGPNGGPASFVDMMDLFFQDYSLGPLFVQDNYIKIKPRHLKEGSIEHLDRLSQVSDDISMGDIISQKIRSSGTGAWSLLPVQSVFSSVSPGLLLSGSLPGGPMGVSFPAWFGKNSTQGKNQRLLGQLSNHIRLATNCSAADSKALIIDYIDPMARCLSQLLKEGDIQSTLDLLVEYKLLREDFDNIMEVTSWPNKPPKNTGIDSKVKAALTRTYNKTSIMLPYIQTDEKVSKNKKNVLTIDEELGDEESGLMANDEDEPGSDKESDPSIIKNNPKKRISLNPKGKSDKTKKNKEPSKKSTKKLK